MKNKLNQQKTGNQPKANSTTLFYNSTTLKGNKPLPLLPHEAKFVALKKGPGEPDCQSTEHLLFILHYSILHFYLSQTFTKGVGSKG